MRLRKPCEHHFYDEHPILPGRSYLATCPGGEFLPEDALVIEKVEADRVIELIAEVQRLGWIVPPLNFADQVGEPG